MSFYATSTQVPVAMASEAALARDYHVSEALTQAIADPAFNLQLRKPPLPRKRVVTSARGTLSVLFF